jgi:hypothetical protein
MPLGETRLPEGGAAPGTMVRPLSETFFSDTVVLNGPFWSRR